MTGSVMNLIGVTALVADSDQFSADLLNRMLRGFGISEITFVKTGEQACVELGSHAYDLLICAATFPDMSGAELVKRVRRLNPPNRFMPILTLTTHAQARSVRAIRDSGVHMIVKKPVSPAVLYDRIAWAAKASRAFVETGVYTGPDRRFKAGNPPGGVARREDDPAAHKSDSEAPDASKAASKG